MAGLSSSTGHSPIASHSSEFCSRLMYSWLDFNWQCQRSYLLSHCTNDGDDHDDTTSLWSLFTQEVNIIMVALCNRANHYIFILFLSSSFFFFPRLISAVGNWMFTILPGHVEEVLLLNKFFSDCRYMPQLQRYSPTKLWDGAQMAIFCVIFASCVFSEPRAASYLAGV